jgi:superoxide dismutase, Fe-Mn family
LAGVDLTRPQTTPRMRQIVLAALSRCPPVSCNSHLFEGPHAIPPCTLFCRPWTLNGISPRLIESHYENNYGTSLNRLNATTPSDVLSRLKRDETAALNSTLLHELYFASFGGDGRVVPDAMADVLARDFGSVDRWRQEFVALSNALANGSGWVVLTYVPHDGRLINRTASDHEQSISGGIPILALDIYEHAYHLDFGANATACVATFTRNIEWNAVQGRFEDAIKVAPPRPLVHATRRRAGYFRRGSGGHAQDGHACPDHRCTAEALHDQIARHHGGCRVCDPERLDEWIGELSKTEPVVTFCVYGFHIGCETAVTLRKAGFDARFMAGGHYAWKAMKGPVKPLPPEA